MVPKPPFPHFLFEEKVAKSRQRRIRLYGFTCGGGRTVKGRSPPAAILLWRERAWKFIAEQGTPPWSRNLARGYHSCRKLPGG